MCNIGKILHMHQNEPAPIKMPRIVVIIPNKIKELVRVRRVQRVEDKEHKRYLDT